ncbi:MAG TPA: hypothetical protein VJJ02_03485 [Candidatus Paceibacterota bacterium]
MSFLVTCSFLSLAALIGIFFYARSRSRTPMFFPGETPEDFGDFIAIELMRMSGGLSRLLRHVRPHGERVLMTSGLYFKKGHDIFIEKVFGHIAVEPGKAASFFLKRIAEHKDALRQEGREKI